MLWFVELVDIVADDEFDSKLDDDDIVNWAHEEMTCCKMTRRIPRWGLWVMDRYLG